MNKRPLRVLTCGDVDSGKSTLLGRLLYDTGLLYKEQLDLLEQYKLSEDAYKYSVLFDGLSIEQEQNITVDISWKSITLKDKRYLFSDTPGHPQYVDNLLTGASTADVAIVVIDALKGITNTVLKQLYYISIMGVSNVIIAINKIDKMIDFCNFAGIVFLRSDLERCISDNHLFEHVTFIYTSGIKGFNITTLYEHIGDKTLLAALEESNYKKDTDIPLIMPVQYVDTSTSNRRYLGTIFTENNFNMYDDFVILPSKQSVKITNITRATNNTINGPVSINVDRDVSITRGMFIADKFYVNKLNDRIVALCITDRSFNKNDIFYYKCGTTELRCFVESSKIVNDVFISCILSQDTNKSVARVVLKLSKPIPVIPYKDNRQLGGFILIHRETNHICAIGMVESAHIQSDIFPQEFTLNKHEYSKQKQQKPFCLWITGLPSSGKSTIANEIAKELYFRNKHVYILDGDNLRLGLNSDLSFSMEDRHENLRRAVEVACLMLDAGLIVIATFITPFEQDRISIRNKFSRDEYYEIYLNTPLEICEQRDIKGLYKKARNNEISNFTGISSIYECPKHANLELDGMLDISTLKEKVFQYIDTIIPL